MSAVPPVDACDFVVFGATGDLATRKLLPALYQRDRDGQLPPETRVLGVSRAGVDDQGFRDKVRGELRVFVPPAELDEEVVERFLARLRHFGMDAADPTQWSELREVLEGHDRVRVFYLACAPRLFGVICSGLANNGLVDDKSRVVLEKPIGHDLASSRAVNDAVGMVFAEEQIFRIDHFLGKEPAQNILAFRFANGLFEPIWNRNFIDHVQIDVPETLGLG
jgi:glucose-6-phosphate 1-dehydrogenase